MSRLIKPPPTTDKQLIRAFDQRIRQLETKQTLRIGDWVVHSTEDGRLLATKPGDVLDVGNPVADVVDLGALRGFVTDSEVAQAVSGGTTNSLTVATGTQVAKDVATQNAQYTADNANAIAAAVEARLNAGTTGYVFNDSFDGDFPTDLGPEWFRTTFGSGGGTYRSDATGVAHQTVQGGAAPQGWIDRHVTPSLTLNQGVSTTLNTVPAESGGFGTEPARHTLMAHMDETNGDRIEGRVAFGVCAIGYTLAGVYTQIDAKGLAMVDGDRWDLVTDSTTHAFILLRNSLTALRFDDVGGVYPLDADHMFGGFGTLAGTSVYYWSTYQTPGPPVQGFNFGDRI